MPDSMLDQGVPVGMGQYVNIVRDVDLLMRRALDEQDDSFLAQAAMSAVATMRVRGVTLAKLLYEWHKHRVQFGITDEFDWMDHVQDRCGISNQTNRKYRGVWETVFENPAVPDSVKDDLIGKPMQGLLLLPAAVREAQLDEDDWERIADSEDPLAIRDVVREARGNATSSGTAITIRIGRDGILTSWQNGESENIGFLKLTDYDSDFAQSAVERILREVRIGRE